MGLKEDGLTRIDSRHVPHPGDPSCTPISPSSPTTPSSGPRPRTGTSSVVACPPSSAAAPSALTLLHAPELGLQEPASPKATSGKEASRLVAYESREGDEGAQHGASCNR